MSTLNQAAGASDTPTVAAYNALEFENATYRKVAWRLLPFIMACYVAAYLDRVNVGFAKLHMLADLQFSEAMYGFGAGLFFYWLLFL